MRFIANRKELVSALSAVSLVIPKRSSKPALACVKLSAAGNRLKLWGTDLERLIVRHNDLVQVESEGEALVNCAELLAIV